MKLQLKPANSSDLDRILEMVREYHHYDHLPFDEGVIRPVLLTLINSPSLGRLWNIYEGDRVVGYTLMTFGFSIEYKGRNAYRRAFSDRGCSRKRLR